MSVSVVIPTTRVSVRALIKSLGYQTQPPDEIIVVTNEDITYDEPGPDDIPVFEVTFSSSHHPIGMGDAGLRRDIGSDMAEGDMLVFLDDDLIAPRTLIEDAVKIAEREGFCWGHHRYIDFASHPLIELLDLNPEAGRSRENGVNRWHGWQSSYAGNLTIKRDVFWAVGGFDLAYLGHHGSEDQQLGHRLGRENGHRTFVHEPPFAWHPSIGVVHPGPETNLTGSHETSRTTINGADFLVCSECPFRVPLDIAGLTVSERVVIPYSREQFTLLKERI